MAVHLVEGKAVPWEHLMVPPSVMRMAATMAATMVHLLVEQTAVPLDLMKAVRTV
jgi:hypothetical protein